MRSYAWRPADAPVQSQELGPIRRIRVAHARDAVIRGAGASGGVVTALLCDLLDRGEDHRGDRSRFASRCPMAALAPHCPDAGRDRARFAKQILRDSHERRLAGDRSRPRPDCDCGLALPDSRSSGIGAPGHAAMKGVSIIIGLYCGNQLYFGATRSFLRRHGVRDLSEVAEIRYRDGLWPGQVRCILKDGRSFAAPKFQFNHLISFYAVERCLLCATCAEAGYLGCRRLGSSLPRCATAWRKPSNEEPF